MNAKVKTVYLCCFSVRENIKIKSVSHVKVLPDETALMRPLKWRSRGNNGDDGN